MSRSKRAPEVSASVEKKEIFRRPDGRLRTGWLLAASLFGYILLQAAAMGLARGFAALFRAWGVDAETVLRAPAWARLFWRWQGSVRTVVIGAALLLLSHFLRRLWLGRTQKAPFEGRRLLLGVAAGLGMATLVLLLGLIPDSLRPEPAAPRFSLTLVALCAVGFLATLAEEAFTKRVLYDGLAPRWGKAWAAIVAVACFFFMNGGLGGLTLSLPNVLLLGALCCAVYGRFGLWAAVGLRWAWSVATVFLFGFGGGEASLLRFYGVSETLLTGGDSGPIYGLWATLLFALALAWVEKDRLYRKRGRG